VFLNKPLNTILSNPKMFSLTSSNNPRSKWFFLSIQKGMPGEVKSLLKTDPHLIFQRDKVLHNTKNQKSCLHIAVEFLKTDLVELFIKKGAFGDAVDKYGYPPLYYSAKRFHLNQKAKEIFKVGVIRCCFGQV
jgi:hypothetical protein